MSGGLGELGAHDLAHYSGDLLYQELGLDGLSICDTSFAFGCYHGFTESAFSDSLDDLFKVANACAHLGEVGSGPWASCIHGIGHGVATYYDSVDEKYKLACARNQPSVMESRMGIEFDRVISICEESTDVVIQQSCIDAIGLRIGNTSGGVVSTIVSSCQLFDNPSFEAVCASAAAGELVFQNLEGWQEKSPAICNSLLGEYRNNCLGRVEQTAKNYPRTRSFPIPIF